MFHKNGYDNRRSKQQNTCLKRHETGKRPKASIVALRANDNVLRRSIERLNTFSVEQEETRRYIDRIIDRCSTVEIRIHTQRDQPQEESLHQVNLLIDNLVMSLKMNPEQARETCVSYMNACASHVVQGITDKKFENVLLGCTLDDQKRVKKRLHGLLSYLEKLNVTTCD